MPEYLAPGVYIEEVATGPRPIEGVSTSTAAFLGATERGPESPCCITSWLEFQRRYGDSIPDVSYLACAVQGFFTNGGQRCFVGRIVPGNAPLATGCLSSGGVAVLDVFALGRGQWGNRIRVQVEAATDRQDPDAFKVSLLYSADLERRDSDLLEVYDNLTARPGEPNSVETVVNGASYLVRVLWRSGASRTRPDDSPFAAMGTGGEGSDDQLTPADFLGDDAPVPGAPATHPDLLGQARGFAALEKIKAISLVAAPDGARSGMEQVNQDLIRHCERLRDRFAIVSATGGQSDPTSVRPPQETSFAAFYYPWIRGDDLRLIPPSGHITGLIARTDIERGVHKAPANGVIEGARGLEFPITRRTRDLLAPHGVNCIRDFRTQGRGIRLDGARTLSGDSQWKYVHLRRLILFLEESIDQGTQWAVFEPNTPQLWGAVVLSISNFLTDVWRNGALQGTTRQDAFFVTCDRTTMTQNDLNNGQLVCYIGVAPLKPAEFVIIRFRQRTSL